MRGYSAYLRVTINGTGIGPIGALLKATSSAWL